MTKKMMMLAFAILVALFCITGCTTTGAVGTDDAITPPAVTATGTAQETESTEETEALDEEGGIAPDALPEVMSQSGTIEEIATNDDGDKVLTIRYDEGGEAQFILNGDTYLISEEELAVGDAFTGWYDATLPMTLQYPPRYTALAAFGGEPEEGESLKVDRFDENLVSSDNMLALNIGDDTRIVDRDGEAHEGEIGGQLLCVRYDISTRSIPAQTTPTVIVVL